MAERFQPHDAFFKSLMNDLTIARDFFRSLLPQDVTESLDLNSLRLENDVFSIGQADMLYSVNRVDNSQLVYLLCEHKSYPDRWVALQVLRYVLEILHRNKQTYSLPLIIPICLYHGPVSPYPYQQNIFELFDDPELAKRFLLNPLTVVDLNKMTDKEIAQCGDASLLLGIQKHIHDKDFNMSFKHLVAHPQIANVLAKSAKQQFYAVLQYLKQCAAISDNERFVDFVIDKMSQKKEDFMAFTDYFFDKGHKEGRKEGLCQGELRAKLKIARQLLRQGMAFDVVAQVTEISSLQLSSYLDETVEL